MSDPAPKKRRIGFFSKIESRDDALDVVKDASYTFFALAGMLAGGGYVLGRSPWFFDAAIYGIGGLWLLRSKSRAAAVTMLLVAFFAAVVALTNGFGGNLGGVSNVTFTAIVLWAAIRGVDATFKLRGRFSEARSGESPGV